MHTSSHHSLTGCRGGKAGGGVDYSSDRGRQIVQSSESDSLLTQNVPAHQTSNQDWLKLYYYRWFLLYRAWHNPRKAIGAHRVQIQEAAWLRDGRFAAAHIRSWAEAVNPEYCNYVQFTPRAIWSFFQHHPDRDMLRDVYAAAKEYALAEVSPTIHRRCLFRPEAGCPAPSTSRTSTSSPSRRGTGGMTSRDTVNPASRSAKWCGSITWRSNRQSAGRLAYRHTIGRDVRSRAARFSRERHDRALEDRFVGSESLAFLRRSS